MTDQVIKMLCQIPKILLSAIFSLLLILGVACDSSSNSSTQNKQSLQEIDPNRARADRLIVRSEQFFDAIRSCRWEEALSITTPVGRDQPRNHIALLRDTPSNVTFDYTPLSLTIGGQWGTVEVDTVTVFLESDERRSVGIQHVVWVQVSEEWYVWAETRSEYSEYGHPPPWAHPMSEVTVGPVTIGPFGGDGVVGRLLGLDEVDQQNRDDYNLDLPEEFHCSWPTSPEI